MIEKPDGSIAFVRVLREEGDGWYEVESELARYSVNINQLVTIKEVIPKKPETPDPLKW
jgi:hypothetical protein